MCFFSLFNEAGLDFLIQLLVCKVSSRADPG